MSTTPPILQHRDARPTLAIPLRVSMAELPVVLPVAFPEVIAWARDHGAEINGAPLIRYRAIGVGESGDVLEIDVGVPIAHPLANAPVSDGRVESGVLPPGMYATLVYTGPYDGLRAATAELLAWGESHGIAWQRSVGPRSERWEARVESYLTDPAMEPDPAHWQTEIALLTTQS